MAEVLCGVATTFVGAAGAAPAPVEVQVHMPAQAE
jgi:hypothetical protein